MIPMGMERVRRMEMETLKEKTIRIPMAKASLRGTAMLMWKPIPTAMPIRKATPTPMATMMGPHTSAQVIGQKDNRAAPAATGR